MGSRTKARECALQALYQLDTSGGTPADALAGLWAHFEPVDEDTKLFAEALVSGARREQTTIDQLIQRTSTNWKLERMARVDRNILRLAVYEILKRSDVPVKVTLNEAIELSKKYGSEEASGMRLAFKKLFVFGLGSARSDEELAARLADALRRLAQAGVKDAALQLPARLAPERGVQTLMEGDGAIARALVFTPEPAKLVTSLSQSSGSSQVERRVVKVPSPPRVSPPPRTRQRPPPPVSPAGVTTAPPPSEPEQPADAPALRPPPPRPQRYVPPPPKEAGPKKKRH